MQGLFVDGARPKSKKQVKETHPDRIRVEATSLHGNEYDGVLTDMPVNTQVHYVGPDPYTSRKFYGTIRKQADGTLKYS